MIKAKGYCRYAYQCTPNSLCHSELLRNPAQFRETLISTFRWGNESQPDISQSYIAHAMFINRIDFCFVFFFPYADNASCPAYTRAFSESLLCGLIFAEEWPWCCRVRDECPIDLINGSDAGNPSKSLLIKRTGLLIKLQDHLIRIQTPKRKKKPCSVNTYQHTPGLTSLVHL